ncbi:MAG: carbamoyltransferase HypF [Bryobacteraceae bacterium]|nr:carbamoyltransferase HypF [Bryobacteraceae bacterium]
MHTRLRILLTGAVQGTGFRPFVYRLARELQLTGFVRNTTGGLHIEVEGEPDDALSFRKRLERERPPASLVLGSEESWLEPAGATDFKILESEQAGSLDAAVLPDLATCPECLAEMRDPRERRFGYPFTNCTRCGPRFTIVLDLPYDRQRTVMDRFQLCPACRREYEDPADRRFHAQPIACPVCGPKLSVSIHAAVEALRHGAIVALKGIGGYQLLCDACCQSAVLRLREKKAREWKPLAVMMPSLDVLTRYAEVGAEERHLLESSAAPIVLLRAKVTQVSPEARPGGRARAGGPALPGGLAESVTQGSPWLGAMLPYSPLHHLLLDEFGGPVVATSGNLSDEPIVTSIEQAHERLTQVADLFVDHDRPIARPCDDSVTRVVLGRESLIRRARGYAPLPVPVRRALPRILAVGGHLKSTVALALGRQVVVSQHIGDLDTPQAREGFERVVDDLCRLYRFSPDVIACDLHPDYWSTRWANAQGKPVVAIQHHEAHAASCAAENDLEGPFLGVSWDGTGYGHDGTIWGSEIFLFDTEPELETEPNLETEPRPSGSGCISLPARTLLKHEQENADATAPPRSRLRSEERLRLEGRLRPGHARRIASLRPFLLPGGEAAVKDTWRCAASLLIASGLNVEGKLATVEPLVRKNLNCVTTSSMGRLFDAVAGLTGICERNRYEGESGLRLEALAMAHGPAEPYPLPCCDLHADWRPMVQEIAREVKSGTPVPRISARFHETLAAWIVGVALKTGVRRVALSGGCFQNAWLTARCAARLEAAGCAVFIHQRVPANDGGLSLGQAVLAASRITR